MLPASDWSGVRIYPRFLCLIGSARGRLQTARRLELGSGASWLPPARNQSDTGSVGIFSRRTNQTQEKRGYILKRQFRSSDATRTQTGSRPAGSACIVPTW
eukprot:2004928-Pyramimonas_sp.AAC.3